MARKLAKKKASTLFYEVLEERVLYSADAAPGLDQHVLDRQPPVDAAISRAASAEQSDLSAPTVQVSVGARRELVIVNPNIDGYEQLIADLQSGDGNHTIDVAILDPDRDGIEQVSEILARQSDLSAVHFITHGADGKINLGNDWLNNATLEQNADQIADWGRALTESGDFLFYGCNVAADGDGQTLLDGIAERTGADVAASDDLTGGRSLGGDWDLEYQVGEIESSSAAGRFNQSSWSHTLDSINVTTTVDENDILSTATISDLQSAPGGTGISLREAIIAANNTAGADTIILGAGTYTLSITNNGEDASATGDLDITSDITIVGAGEGSTAISASGLGDRAFDVKSGATLTLNDLTVAGVNTNNQTGGAVSNAGTLSATDVVFRDNTNTNNPGGGLYNSGSMTLDRVSIINNTAAAGGGIEQANGTLTMTNVTISGNSSLYNGAGLEISGGTATNIDYTTVANNSTTSNGSGGGLYSTSGTVNISNSIFADNTSQFNSGDVTGSVNSGGYNIFEDVAGFTTDATDQTADPGLAALALDADSGQYVQAITDSSNAYNAAGGSAPTTDQRGIARDANPDIGAYEVGSPNSPPTITSDGGGATAAVNAAENQTSVTTVAATDADGDTPIYSISGGTDAALFGIDTNTGVLTFNAAPDFEHPTDSNTDNVYEVQVTASDGNGGTDIQAISVTVTDANDAPAGADNSISINEDTAYTFTAADFGYSDVDGNNLSRVWITTLPAQGQLMWNGATFAAGNWVAIVDIDAGQLTYAPVANASGTGYASFTFQVEDDGGTANGGINKDPSPKTMTIDVAPVNDAPVGLPTITGTAVEDQALTADTTGISDADGLGSFNYRWLRDGVAISGATSSSYTLATADVGHQIAVLVGYTDGQGTDETLQSAPSAPVASAGGASVGNGDTGSLPDLDLPTGDPGTGETVNTDLGGGSTDGTLPEHPHWDLTIDSEISQEPDPHGPGAGDNPATLATVTNEGDPQQFIVPADGSDSGTRAGNGEHVYWGHDSRRELFISKPVDFKSAGGPPAVQQANVLNGIDPGSQVEQQLDARGDYDLLRQQLDDAFHAQMQRQAFKSKVLTISYTSFTAGIVSYFLRASSLAASLLSSLPAWRRFDPIAVFGGKRKKRKDQDASPDAADSGSEAFFNDGKK
jgi:Domain of unknown function (DUF4347)/Bacterial cadherin-like domain